MHRGHRTRPAGQGPRAAPASPRPPRHHPRRAVLLPRGRPGKPRRDDRTYRGRRGVGFASRRSSRRRARRWLLTRSKVVRGRALTLGAATAAMRSSLAARPRGARPETPPLRSRPVIAAAPPPVPDRSAVVRRRATMPVEGRILDLEGRPVAGATVSVQHVQSPPTASSMPGSTRSSGWASSRSDCRMWPARRAGTAVSPRPPGPTAGSGSTGCRATPSPRPRSPARASRLAGLHPDPRRARDPRQGPDGRRPAR